MIIPIEEKNKNCNSNASDDGWTMEDTFIPNDFWAICKFNPHDFYDKVTGIPTGCYQFVDDIIAICITLEKFGNYNSIPLSTYMEKRKIEDREEAARDLVIHSLASRNAHVAKLIKNSLDCLYDVFFVGIRINEIHDYAFEFELSEIFYDFFNDLRTDYKENSKSFKKSN